MSSSIRPLRDRIVVRRAEDERKSSGGIVIPDTATEKPVRGQVIAIGRGKVLDDGKILESELKVGDQVLFGKYAGTEVELNGEKFVVMLESDVMGVIQG